MPRLTNTRTNVRVRVSEEKAARMGPEWAPEQPEKSTGKTASRKPKSEK